MLEVLMSAARILLAAVFVVAAVAKLVDLEGTRRAVRDFGAPERLAGLLAPALVLAELAVAGLLIPASTAVAGAAGALALLLLFGIAIATSLARGRAPDCHCFGRLHSAPAGPATLARNGALAALAGFVLVGSLAEPPAGAFAWVGDPRGTEALALGLGVALAVFVAAGVTAFLTLLRSYGGVLVRVERLESVLAEAGYELDALDDEPMAGLEPGTQAPGFDLVATGGERVGLDDLLAPRLPILLLFTSAGCGPCEALLPDVANWQATHADRLTVAIFEEGEPAEIRATAARFGISNVLADTGGGAYDAYEANGTPSGVLIAADGTVASHLAAGPGRIAELVAGVLDAPGLPPGAPAPALDGLSALSGAAPGLGGRESLVVFWNPDCGFCRSMHEELLEWEAGANGSSPQLVLISSGDEERTRAEGFRSPVLLDPDWSMGEAFGAAGTPSAVLIDVEGRVASEVMVGAEAILGRVARPAPDARRVAAWRDRGRLEQALERAALRLAGSHLTRRQAIGAAAAGSIALAAGVPRPALAQQAQCPPPQFPDDTQVCPYTKDGVSGWICCRQDQVCCSKQPLVGSAAAGCCEPGQTCCYSASLGYWGCCGCPRGLHECGKEPLGAQCCQRDEVCDVVDFVCRPGDECPNVVCDGACCEPGEVCAGGSCCQAAKGCGGSAAAAG